MCACERNGATTMTHLQPEPCTQCTSIGASKHYPLIVRLGLLLGIVDKLNENSKISQCFLRSEPSEVPRGEIFHWVGLAIVAMLSDNEKLVTIDVCAYAPPEYKFWRSTALRTEWHNCSVFLGNSLQVWLGWETWKGAGKEIKNIKKIRTLSANVQEINCRIACGKFLKLEIALLEGGCHFWIKVWNSLCYPILLLGTISSKIPLVHWFGVTDVCYTGDQNQDGEKECSHCGWLQRWVNYSADTVEWYIGLFYFTLDLREKKFKWRK